MIRRGIVILRLRIMIHRVLLRAIPVRTAAQFPIDGHASLPRRTVPLYAAALRAVGHAPRPAAVLARVAEIASAADVAEGPDAEPIVAADIG